MGSAVARCCITGTRAEGRDKACRQLQHGLLHAAREVCAPRNASPCELRWLGSGDPGPSAPSSGSRGLAMRGRTGRSSMLLVGWRDMRPMPAGRNGACVSIVGINHLQSWQSMRLPGMHSGDARLIR